ncbi:hypothetical protein BS50DRAFT_592609 [Corynespora cassiicola Philippines]|uniref:Uncharacterized protein n=1 Tax=Corynespora cassiicola Philippines TaxID=1448308 RepID=A0A2T2N895_CORCC|nr:hypothetical protein BS50DRAFT_592609 [Corynespora cassiicola Philippines]
MSSTSNEKTSDGGEVIKRTEHITLEDKAHHTDNQKPQCKHHAGKTTEAENQANIETRASSSQIAEADSVVARIFERINNVDRIALAGIQIANEVEASLGRLVKDQAKKEQKIAELEKRLAACKCGATRKKEPANDNAPDKLIQRVENVEKANVIEEEVIEKESVAQKEEITKEKPVEKDESYESNHSDHLTPADEAYAHEDSKHNYDAKLYNTKTASRLTDKLRAFHHIETNEEIPEFPSTALELLGMDVKDIDSVLRAVHPCHRIKTVKGRLAKLCNCIGGPVFALEEALKKGDH